MWSIQYLIYNSFEAKTKCYNVAVCVCMSGQESSWNWPRFLDLSKLCEINVCTSSSVWFIREIFSFHRQNSLWIWLTLWQLTDPETIGTHNGRNQQPWIPLLRSNSFLSNSISTLTIKVSNFSERILGNGIFWTLTNNIWTV